MRMGLARPRAKVGKCMSRLSRQSQASRSLVLQGKPPEKGMMPAEALTRQLRAQYTSVKSLVALVVALVAVMIATSALSIAPLCTGIAAITLLQRLFGLSHYVSGLLSMIIGGAAFMPSTSLWLRVFNFITGDEHPRWQRWVTAVFYYGALAAILWLTGLLTPEPGKH